MDILRIVAVIGVSYLLGAIPFGLLVARWHGVKDVRSMGSGNIGATNVWRVAGARAAIWVFVLDIGKGVIAVLVARFVTQNTLNPELLMVLAGGAAVIGHIFPAYLRFRGGKGVNTGLGVMLSLLPIETLLCVVIFVVVLFASKYVSLGSIVAALCLPAIVAVEQFGLKARMSGIFLPLTLLLSLTIVVTHRANIRRLLSGTENRFRLKSKTEEAGRHV